MNCSDCGKEKIWVEPDPYCSTFTAHICPDACEGCGSCKCAGRCDNILCGLVMDVEWYRAVQALRPSSAVFVPKEEVPF